MHVLLALPYYLSWHYTIAYSDMVLIWRNFLLFFYNFFSISNLTFSLFSPWHKMNESYGWGFEQTVGTFIINTLMRLVGAFMRSIIILCGLLSILVCIILGVLVFVMWTILPFGLVYTLLQGINLITS